MPNSMFYWQLIQASISYAELYNNVAAWHSQYYMSIIDIVLL